MKLTPTPPRASLAGTSSLQLFHVELSSDSSSDGGGEAASTSNTSNTAVAAADASERLEIVTTQRPFKALTFTLRNAVDRFSVVDDDQTSEFSVFNIGKQQHDEDDDDTPAAADTSPSQKKPPLQRKSFVASASAPAAAAAAASPSDYTLYDATFSKISLSAFRVAGYHWTQLVHRAKHADLEIYLGNNYQRMPPLATLRCTARSSRILHLQRFHDKGIVYTLTKDKIMGHRVFFITEGGGSSTDFCRMVLVVRRGRATVKFMTDADQRVFNATCLEYSEGDSTVKIARGMDLVLAFACLCLADRFESYKSFAAGKRFLRVV